MDKYNTLGIEIKYTFDGTHPLMSYNSSIQWTKHVGEIVEKRQLQKPDNYDWHFIVLQKIDCGHIIRIICSNAGRNDYMSASIFVPWKIVVSGKRLSEIIEIVETELLNWNKDTSKTKLEKIFSETYEVLDIQQSPMELLSNKIAYRFYGEMYQLYELLDNLNQPYYSLYKFIFLIDKESNIQCNAGDDLTEESLISSVIINPPQDFNGFKPYIGNELFSKPIKEYINTSLHISWRRNGYKDIEKTTNISGNDIVLNIPAMNECKILVPYNRITVKDKKGNRIDQYTLMINNEIISPNNYAEIIEDSISKVDVIVSANGYEQHHTDKDLRNNCEIKLEKNLEKSPIEGYKTENRKIDPDYDNQLHYHPFTKKHLIFFAIVVALSLCIGIGTGWFVKGRLSKSEIKELKTEIKKLESRQRSQNNANTSRGNNNVVAEANSSPNTEVDKTANSSNEEISVIDYLDNNKTWNRDTMEGYEETKGLWDAMNERRFDDILKYRDKLNDSKNFIKIFECVENNRHKTGLGKYNTKASDFNITIENYMIKLDSAPSKPKQNEDGNKSKSGTRNGNKKIEQSDL